MGFGAVQGKRVQGALVPPWETSGDPLLGTSVAQGWQKAGAVGSCKESLHGGTVPWGSQAGQCPRLSLAVVPHTCPETLQWQPLACLKTIPVPQFPWIVWVGAPDHGATSPLCSTTCSAKLMGGHRSNHRN